jgi:hypothetical protein
MNKISINFDIPESYYNKAKYIFSIYSKAWGIPLNIYRNQSIAKDADIVYTRSTQNAQWDERIIIPFDERLYEKNTECDVITKNGYSLWVNSSEKINIDLIASTYRLLNFTDETQINPNARDDKGIFLIQALPDNRKKITKLPIVEDHINFLLKKLLINNPSLEKSIIPRWPNGKKYVLSITHDTDATNLGSPKELLANLTKLLIRQDRVFFEMFKDGLKHVGNIVGNPLFGFSGWKEYESLNNATSCFYLYVKPQKVKVHLNDCKSNLKNEIKEWNILRQLAENNWEFGFHPSINAKNNIDEFIYGKQLLESKLGTNIYGLRHHYWALDWFRPYLTFRKHVNAGFKYDTSIAWKDEPGFRAGTCLPFQPFDIKRDKPFDLYELPTCLMDGHIIKSNVVSSDIIQAGKNIIETIKKRSGVAVLDWHTESYCNTYVYKNYLEILQNILKDYYNDSDLWIATPWEIIKWWHRRSLILMEGKYDR